MGTYSLRSIKGKTSEDRERKKASKGHPQAIKHRNRNKLGYEKKVSEQGALTPYKAHRQRQIRA